MLQKLAETGEGFEVEDLAEAIGRSRVSVSNHKPELVDAGIIEEDVGQSTIVTLADGARNEAAGISASVADSRIIQDTTIDNVTTDLSYPERKDESAGEDDLFYRATAYRSRGIDSILNKTIEIVEENP